MRTTLTIDDDVLDRARTLADRLHSPFRRVVNEALRAGLQEVEKPARSRPYRTRARKLGLKAGRNVDNIQELIAQIEGDEHLVTDAHLAAVRDHYAGGVVIDTLNNPALCSASLGGRKMTP